MKHHTAPVINWRIARDERFTSLKTRLYKLLSNGKYEMPWHEAREIIRKEEELILDHYLSQL